MSDATDTAVTEQAPPGDRNGAPEARITVTQADLDIARRAIEDFMPRKRGGLATEERSNKLYRSVAMTLALQRTRYEQGMQQLGREIGRQSEETQRAKREHEATLVRLEGEREALIKKMNLDTMVWAAGSAALGLLCGALLF